MDPNLAIDLFDLLVLVIYLFDSNTQILPHFPSKQYGALHIKSLLLFTFYNDVTAGFVRVYVIQLLSPLTLPLISSFQAKREELLQYAQGAVSGLKINADLERWSRIFIFFIVEI